MAASDAMVYVLISRYIGQERNLKHLATHFCHLHWDKFGNILRLVRVAVAVAAEWRSEKDIKKLRPN